MSRLDRVMQRSRPQRALAWLGRWIAPHVPARHSIAIDNTYLHGESGMQAPIIQINEPNGGRASVGGRPTSYMDIRDRLLQLVEELTKLQ